MGNNKLASLGAAVLAAIGLKKFSVKPEEKAHINGNINGSKN